MNSTWATPIICCECPHISRRCRHAFVLYVPHFVITVTSTRDICFHYHITTSRQPLRWRHNGLDIVSNHQPHHCLLNRLFRRRSKKTSKLRVTGLCVGNSPGTGEFPAQMASNAENVSIWWRHHDLVVIVLGRQTGHKVTGCGMFYVMARWSRVITYSTEFGVFREYEALELLLFSWFVAVATCRSSVYVALCGYTGLPWGRVSNTRFITFLRNSLQWCHN